MYNRPGGESNKLDASEQTYTGETSQREERTHRFTPGYKALAAGAGLAGAGLIALRQRHKHTHTPRMTRGHAHPSLHRATLHSRGREGFLGSLRHAVFH